MASSSNHHHHHHHHLHHSHGHPDSFAAPSSAAQPNHRYDFSRFHSAAASSSSPSATPQVTSTTTPPSSTSRLLRSASSTASLNASSSAHSQAHDHPAIRLLKRIQPPPRLVNLIVVLSRFLIFTLLNPSSSYTAAHEWWMGKAAGSSGGVDGLKWKKSDDDDTTAPTTPTLPLHATSSLNTYSPLLSRPLRQRGVSDTAPDISPGAGGGGGGSGSPVSASPRLGLRSGGTTASGLTRGDATADAAAPNHDTIAILSTAPGAHPVTVFDTLSGPPSSTPPLTFNSALRNLRPALRTFFRIHFVPLLAFSAHTFLIWVFFITVYMVWFRDPPLPPYQHHGVGAVAPFAPPLVAAPLFSPVWCYLDQTKFMLGMTLHGDRIRHKKGGCGAEVVAAAVKERSSERFWKTATREAEGFGVVKTVKKNKDKEKEKRDDDSDKDDEDTEDVDDDDYDKDGYTCPRLASPGAGDPTRLFLDLSHQSALCNRTAPYPYPPLAPRRPAGPGGRPPPRAPRRRRPRPPGGGAPRWRGWGHRMRMYHDHLVSTLHPSTLVVLSDGNDVLLNPSCDADAIRERWSGRRGSSGGRWPPTAPIVAAAEKACFPDGNRWWDYIAGEAIRHLPDGVPDLRNHPNPRAPVVQAARVFRARAEGVNATAVDEEWTELKARWKRWDPDAVAKGATYRYLNAGTVIGRAGDVAALLRRTYEHDCLDDQRALSARYLAGDVFWTEDDPEEAGVKERRDAGVEGKEASPAAGPHPAPVPASPSSAKLVQQVEDTMRVVWALETELYNLTTRVLGSARASPATPFSAEPADADDASKLKDVRTRLEAAKRSLEDVVGRLDGAGRRRQGRRDAAAPDHARPLMALDLGTDLVLGAYGLERDEIDVVEVPPGSVAGKKGKGKKPLKTFVVKETGGEPCFVHQSGPKRLSALLEELARDIGEEYSQRHIDKVKFARWWENKGAAD
ncbi:hypothetical protein HDU96_009908 [Phlyctochytrium bullatum]|nr:hypothetical protein HDU96_009908 [Phlyctochytrium bullatum]